MKFTNGYWDIRKEISPDYGVEYWSHEVKDDELIIYVLTKAATNRGMTLNIPLLTVTLSSPIKNIIKVSEVHHIGGIQKDSLFQKNAEDVNVKISENEESLIYQSGTVKAVISKKPNEWGITFYDHEQILTETSHKNMAYMKNNDTGKTYMVDQLALDIGEYVYGLGERFTPFVKNGQVIEMWNGDGGTASEIAYKNVPFYMTNKGYGIFVDHTEDVAYEVASEKVSRVQFSVEGEHLEYYVIAGGNPKGTVELYTKLTGKPALPPEWSFGLWLTTSFITDYDEETVKGFINGMGERNIPLHVFHFDCFWMDALEWCNFEWDKKVFPEPKEMLERFHQQDLKVCVWINPYIAQKSKLFKEAMEQGYLVKKSNGSVWQTDIWQAGMGIVDFTNPKAKEWFKDKLDKLVNMGVDSFKTDFGEKIPVRDIVYYDGSDPVKMHNYYTQLYNQAVFEVLEDSKGRGEATLFARSATAGGQQFPVHWGGDCEASYASMAETLRGGLSLATCGFGFWSHDISGFVATASADLYKRWCAFGLLSSHSRLHGLSTYKVPWLYDDEASDVLKKFVEMKCELMPYIYGQSVQTHLRGIPFIRPMFMEFHEDKACETLDRQYMFGENLLVAPLFNEQGIVDYYLPKGTWINYFTEEKVEGGQWMKEIHDYFSLPLMIRENTILPIGNNVQRPDYNYLEALTLKLSHFTEGGISNISIPNSQGHTVLDIQAKRKGNIVYITLSEEITNISIVFIGDNSSKRIIQGKSIKMLIN